MQLVSRKAERDAARLTQQREDLRRQLARWVAPDVMRGLQRDLDGPGGQAAAAEAAAAGAEGGLTERQREKATRVAAEREEAQQRRHDRMAARYSRHAMTVHLAQVRPPPHGHTPWVWPPWRSGPPDAQWLLTPCPAHPGSCVLRLCHSLVSRPHSVVTASASYSAASERSAGGVCVVCAGRWRRVWRWCPPVEPGAPFAACASGCRCHPRLPPAKAYRQVSPWVITSG